MTLRILTICTGNICRSPFAAKLLATRLDRTQFKIASAGTSAMLGDPMHATLQQIAQEMGIRGTGRHRAHALTPRLVSQADLLLGMERDHRSAAAKLQPSAARRSFTLKEFAHVASYINDGQLQTLLLQREDSSVAAIDAVMRMRGVVPRLAPDRLYDLQDPYGRSSQVFARSALQIEQAVDRIASFFDRAAKLSAALHNGQPKIATMHDRK